MRPVRAIDPAFFAADEPMGEHLPLLDAYVDSLGGARPLAHCHVLLAQHQLSDQIAMVRALLELGLRPDRFWWLDIPYTSNAAVRDYVCTQFGVAREQLVAAQFRVLEPYAPFQHARAIKMLLDVLATTGPDAPLLILDDGAYLLEAIASLTPARRPKHVAVVEQTTRGFIKIAGNASLQRTAATLPLVDVARSQPKRTLEPPFIAMAVCAALEPHLKKHFRHGLQGRCLVLGYGAIGEQVTCFVRHHFRVPKEQVFVYDRTPAKAELARQRKYPDWPRHDFHVDFQLVIGCSGEASFTVGDAAYLEPGALLVSASSGAVELSRQDFIELAEASPSDDIAIVHEGLDPYDVHADLTIRLPHGSVRFLNGGFPVNFSGRQTVCPTRFIQPTPTMMVAAAVQAAGALGRGTRGVLKLDAGFCDWVDPLFRRTLGARVEWLLPAPDSAW
jgi:S-adenosylhomocysteine hydrolase